MTTDLLIQTPFLIHHCMGDGSKRTSYILRMHRIDETAAISLNCITLFH
jgi:hypothetical protein